LVATIFSRMVDKGISSQVRFWIGELLHNSSSAIKTDQAPREAKRQAKRGAAAG
jgi:hypothetical protein